MEKKKCKYCQSEIDSKAKICPHCKKKQRNPIVRLIGIVLIIIGIVVIVSGLGGSGEQTSNKGSKEEKCYITLEEFNKIENGMSYEQVKDIVGCDGTVTSDTEIEDVKMTIYSWYGKDGISNANVSIQSGKLINKTQIGLS